MKTSSPAADPGALRAGVGVTILDSAASSTARSRDRAPADYAHIQNALLGAVLTGGQQAAITRRSIVRAAARLNGCQSGLRQLDGYARGSQPVDRNGVCRLLRAWPT